MRTTEERLSALENQVRTYRRLSLILILLLSVGLTAALVQDKEKKEKVIECDVLKAQKIETQSIELNSKKRGKTHITPGGAEFISADKIKSITIRPGAILLGGKEDAVMMINGSFLMLLLGDGRSVVLGSHDGAGYLELENHIGNGSIRLDMKSGDGEIRVRNQYGENIALIQGDKDSNGQVWVFDEAGKNGKVLKPGK